MALGSVRLQLYIYDGTEGSYTETDLKYTMNKSIITGDTNIVLEIGELIRDYLDMTFNNDYTCTAKWVTAVVYYYDDKGNSYTSGNPRAYNFIAVDGYGMFEDEINPELQRHVLITSNNMYLPESTAGKLPIFAEGVGKVNIDGNDTQITDNGNNNQKIQYIDVPANSSTIKIYDTDDTTLLKTITVNNICEPKYTPYKVTFVNKYGAFEDVYFFKKTIEQFNVTKETYKTNSINTGTVTYNTYGTQSQMYNVNGKTKLTLNTGFIVEDYVSAIEELLLSENIWIRFEGRTLPINSLTNTMQIKSSVNDRLIDYTLEFEFAFDKINNIR